MSPQWMPQNLQKRLLLYILQQLSLFSEIDLPNLEEVSLSNIQLKDVSLDPEKVGKLPGCTFRFGELKQVEVKGGVVGGVNLNITGVDLVLATNIDDFDGDIKNMSMSLAQSTANLANTVIFEGDLPESSASALQSESDSDSDPESSSNSSSIPSHQSATSQRRPSALGGVMSRALEIALSRIQVTISDVNIKIITESVDLLVSIESISFSTTNKQHSLKIKAIRVSTLDPNTEPGHGVQKSTDRPRSESESEDQFERSSEDDSADDSLMSSTVFTHEEASSVYMSATAHSFSKPNESSFHEGDPSVHLLFVDFMDVSFDGLSPLTKLQVKVDTVRSAAVPIAPTISLIAACTAKICRSKLHQLRKQHVSSRRSALSGNQPAVRSSLHEDKESSSNEFSNSIEEAGPVFDRLQIGSFYLSLTSAINDKGDFASTSDDITFAATNINVKQKDETLTFGGVEKLRILRIIKGEESELFNFDSVNTVDQSTSTPSGLDFEPSSRALPTRADVRFEYFKAAERPNNPEITVLLSKRASIRLHCDSLSYLLNFFDAVQKVRENITALLSELRRLNVTKFSVESMIPKPNQSDGRSEIIFQTSSIDVEFCLSDSSSLICKVFPISFNTTVDNLRIQRVTVESHINGSVDRLFTIPDVRFETQPVTITKFDTSASSPFFRKDKVTSSMNIYIEEIVGSIAADKLKNLGDKVRTFVSGIQSRSSKVNAMTSSSINGYRSTKDPKSVNVSTLGQSAYVGERFGRVKQKSSFKEVDAKPSVSFSIHISSITLTLVCLFPRFGDLVFQSTKVQFTKWGDISSGIAKQTEIFRINEHAKIKEMLFQCLPSTSPTLIMHHDSNDKGTTIDITVRKFLIDYHTHWMQLFERTSQGHTAEELAQATSPSSATIQKKRFDLRFSFDDFVLGLHPGRLPSQIGIAIEKGSSDFTFAKEQFYVKSSFRNSSLFLIDDWRNLRNPTQHSQEVSMTHYMSQRGFLQCGYINSSHVGITVNTDIKSVKARNDSLGIRGELPLLDIKLNSDEHIVEVCADSFQTLIQSFNDLKVPLTFKNHEKYRFHVDKGFQWPTDLRDQINEVQKNMSISTGDLCTPPPMPQRPTKDAESYYYDTSSTHSRTEDSTGCEDGISSRLSDITIVDEHFRDQDRKTDAAILPMSIAVNLTKARLYFYDGYDWKSTRKSLRQAVKNMEKKAMEIRSKKAERKKSSRDSTKATRCDSTKRFSDEIDNIQEEYEDEDGKEISETLFQSIYLGMPEDSKMSSLVSNINSEMQAVNKERAMDEALNPNINVDVEKHYKDLRLKRSGSHKVSLDVQNVEVYVKNFTNRDPRVDATAEGIDKELVNQVEVRLDSFTMYDNVSSSTWNKFLTYMSVLGEREVGTYMLQFSILNVRPEPTMPYTEVLMNVKLLPLRLFVDQDTLMFLGRFFQFRDNRFNLPVDEPIFVQKLEISPIRLKFDYKPKAMNYSGFRAGQGAELANLFILDSADLRLAKTVAYGILGFPKLGLVLKDIYVPYIQKYQIAGLLSGLAPVKSLINIGEGFKNLVTIPMKEYKRNGQLMKSFQKGTKSFTKTTAYELLKLGVKVVSGTQTILESSEQYVGGEGHRARQKSKPNEQKKPSRRLSNEFSTLKQENQKQDLLQASQLMKKNVPLGEDSQSDEKLYSVMSMDDVLEEDDVDSDDMEPSVLILDTNEEDSSCSDEDKELDQEEVELAQKMVSLYSNQPVNTKEGLKYAYKSLGKNLKSTKKTIAGLSEELRRAENLQEQLSSVARTSPMIVIRPMIGTTEAIMKTLMGLSNEIDPTYIVENREKYGSDEKGENRRKTPPFLHKERRRERAPFNKDGSVEIAIV
ncbi:hypothetical protein RJF_3245 [Candidozyma auris]